MNDFVVSFLSRKFLETATQKEHPICIRYSITLEQVNESKSNDSRNSVSEALALLDKIKKAIHQTTPSHKEINSAEK